MKYNKSFHLPWPLYRHASGPKMDIKDIRWIKIKRKNNSTLFFPFDTYNFYKTSTVAKTMILGSRKMAGTKHFIDKNRPTSKSSRFFREFNISQSIVKVHWVFAVICIITENSVRIVKSAASGLTIYRHFGVSKRIGWIQWRS